MKKLYVSNASLLVKNSQVMAVFDSSQKKTQTIKNKSWLTILEIFIHEQALEKAYRIFQSINGSPIPERLLKLSKRVRNNSDNIQVLLFYKSLQVKRKGFFIDLKDVSQETFQVTHSLFYREKFAGDNEKIHSFEDFCQSIHNLVTLGLLSPATNTLEWGDLRRRFPLCSWYGLTRGTPIDRYYVNRFIDEIRSQVSGNVLEVGGVLGNRELYQFDNASEYNTLDIIPGQGITLVGDVHDAEVIPPGSLDSLVIINVLEHCQNPLEVVRNIHNWLRVGGKCFCMVPNAQKLHDFPRDFWRLQPDGLKLLFQVFSRQKFFIYGNPLTVVANFMGIASEELSREELDDIHPDYPVATCMIALK